MLLQVGGLSRVELLSSLAAAGVGLNASSETLLADPTFDVVEASWIEVVQRTVGELGLGDGASLSQILSTAGNSDCCPALP